MKKEYLFEETEEKEEKSEYREVVSALRETADDLGKSAGLIYESFDFFDEKTRGVRAGKKVNIFNVDDNFLSLLGAFTSFIGLVGQNLEESARAVEKFVKEAKDKKGMFSGKDVDKWIKIFEDLLLQKGYNK